MFTQFLIFSISLSPLNHLEGNLFNQFNMFRQKHVKLANFPLRFLLSYRTKSFSLNSYILTLSCQIVDNFYKIALASADCRYLSKSNLFLSAFCFYAFRTILGIDKTKKGIFAYFLEKFTFPLKFIVQLQNLLTSMSLIILLIY